MKSGTKSDRGLALTSGQNEEVVFCRNILWVDSLRKLSKEVIITSATYRTMLSARHCTRHLIHFEKSGGCQSMQEQEPKRKGVNKQKKIDQIETGYKNMFFDVVTVEGV